MAARTRTFIDEMVSAARGCAGLLVGNRTSPGHFDFSRRGIAGSFIAFLLAQLIAAYGPVLMGARPEPGAITRVMLMVAILYAAQIGFAAILLRQIGRLDGLLPYLVADNWATFFISIGASILAPFGFGGEFELLVTGLLVILIDINIARLIVTLPGLQIAMFIIAQLVGISIGLIFIGFMFPAPALPPV